VCIEEEEEGAVRMKAWASTNAQDITHTEKRVSGGGWIVGSLRF